MNTQRIQGPSFPKQSSITHKIDYKVTDRKKTPTHLSARSLDFSYNKEIQQVVVQVMVDGVQVEQIPPEDTLKFLVNFRAARGPLIDEEI